jgi:hypothetical protein
MDKPVPESVPTVVLPTANPSIAQVTSVMAEFETDAIKVWDAPVPRVATPGLRATLTALFGPCTTTVDVAFLLASSKLVTVRTWLPSVSGAI